MPLVSERVVCSNFVLNVLDHSNLEQLGSWGLAKSCHRFRLMRGMLSRAMLRLKQARKMIRNVGRKREHSLQSIFWIAVSLQAVLKTLTKKGFSWHGVQTKTFKYMVFKLRPLNRQSKGQTFRRIEWCSCKHCLFNDTGKVAMMRLHALLVERYRQKL